MGSQGREAALTRRYQNGIMKLEPPGYIAYHWRANGKHRRRVLFRIDGNNIMILNPGEKKEECIGQVIRDPGGLLIMILTGVVEATT